MGAVGTSSTRRWLEWSLMATGIGLLSWSAIVIVQADHEQGKLRTALERSLDAPPAPSPSRAPLKRGSLIGSLQIPRLKLTAMVVEGDDDKTLKTGIGHLPDTPLPWEKGNAALAGHRDTFLRAMRDISAGDEIRLKTPHGDFAYRVREIAIVTPDNLAGLSKTEDSTLTLITCYPFSFVGNAPKRFVVRAWPIRTPAPHATR